MAAGRRRWWAVAAVVASVLLVDHLTKWWALQTLDDRIIDLVGSLRLRLVFNTGAAFGLGSRYAPLLAIGALVVVAVVVRTERLLGTRLGALSVGLVLGGALGNLADRLFRADGGFLSGAVVDFVDLQWWPVFNVADVAITGGAVLLALTAGREPADPEPESSAAPPTDPAP